MNDGDAVRCDGCGQKVGEREADGDVVIRLSPRNGGGRKRVIRGPVRSVECERCGAVTDVRLRLVA